MRNLVLANLTLVADLWHMGVKQVIASKASLLLLLQQCQNQPNFESKGPGDVCEAFLKV